LTSFLQFPNLPPTLPFSILLYLNNHLSNTILHPMCLLNDLVLKKRNTTRQNGALELGAQKSAYGGYVGDL
jgi:hypothetical protein